ncbi:MAG: hypothetical protein SGPRY_012776 [Prymnesium sp.]
MSPEVCRSPRHLITSACPLLTPSECAAWIGWAEARGFQREKLARTSSTALRDQWRMSLHSPELAAALFQRLVHFDLPPPLVGASKCAGCNPNLRLYKYEQGQRFGPHVDESNALADGTKTQLTVLVYLNQEFEGGETAFYRDHRATREAYTFVPRQGAVLLHAHGAQCLTHEAMPVRRGVKYVLRTDVAYSNR